MVARLLWLKARLIWNGLRADWQRRLGLPAIVVLLFWIGWQLAARYLEALAGLSPAGKLQLSLWAALGFWVLWVSLPVVIFPLDENLDPAQFALSPVPPLTLITGLGLAGLLAPSVLIVVVVLGANLAAFADRLAVAVVATLLHAAILVVSGQLLSTGISAVLRTRRGRDLSVLIVVAIALFGFSAQLVVRRAVTSLGLERALLAHPLDGWAGLLPPVAAQRLITEMIAGRPMQAVAAGAVALGWIVALAWMWHRLLQWLLTTPEDHAPTRTARGGGLANGRLWGIRSVMARKELLFYLRDPRQRLVWTGAVIFVGLAAASLLVGTGGLAAFRTRSWLPLLAPALVMMVGLPIALNLFGWERNAASFLFVLPAGPRQLLAGKNLAATMALLVETFALAVFLAILSEGWYALRFVPSLALAAVGCQLAVGNIVSVVAPLRLPREGTDVFAQATEQGCLAIAAQLTSFFVIGLLLVVPGSVTVLAVDFGRAMPASIAHLVSIGWGFVAYAISLWLAGGILRRRVPEVVNWVQVV